MIARIWHGRTSREKANDYLQFLLTDGTREYLQTPGNRSVKVWRNPGSDDCEFYTVTEWDSLDAIRKFAGDELEKAVYYPQDQGVLLEFEDHVRHYECYDVSREKIRSYLRQLDELHDGGSWQGESFSGKLNDVDEQTAFAAPAPGVHSVAEIVWHCIYWRTVLIRRLEGDHGYREATVKSLNFLAPDALKKKGWDQLKAALEKTRTDIAAHLRSRNDSFLSAEYQPGKTYEHLLEGIIQHDVYHLGQIGLIRKMVSLK